MNQYQAPLRDMQFVLFELLKVQQFWQQSNHLKDVVDQDLATAMLDEAAKITSETLSPINRIGDEQGVQFDKGMVTTPDGFKAAFQLFVEGGWIGIAGNPQYQGLGMPKTLAVQVDEMLFAANTSMALYTSLTNGVCLALASHASDKIKQVYLPKLYSGTWLGTMCLTESHAGSDLGQIRTKAVPNKDGSYQITGTKIFITGGEHNLCENIVHLVLAKLPDAPVGSRGISLFLVSKYNLNESGEVPGPVGPVSNNGVSCGSIEHKMGINASATCVMNFDDAEGFLIGEVNRGLVCMFTMMNLERLSIGIQGIGCSQMSYQNALAYAQDRKQGRNAATPSNRDCTPIINHMDVKRMLLNMKSLIEGGRACAGYIAQLIDEEKYTEDKDQAARANALVNLLTPVAKAFFSDTGFENTVTGQLIFGGHGYIREWGQEQLIRDARIAQIYEGTNGIQAQDLLERKILPNDGAYFTLFETEISEFIECNKKIENSELKDIFVSLESALEKLIGTTSLLQTEGAKDRLILGAAAVDYLQLFGYVTYAYLWARMAIVATEKQSEGEFYVAKLNTARYYFKRVLPRIDSLISTIEANTDELKSFGNSWL